MADVSQPNTDEPVISFDLGDIFNQNQAELDQLNVNDIPDSDLCQLMHLVNEDFLTLLQNTSAAKLQADNAVILNAKRSSIFQTSQVKNAMK